MSEATIPAQGPVDVEVRCLAETPYETLQDFAEGQIKVAPKIVRYYWPHPYAIGPHGYRKGRTWYGRRWTDVVVGYEYSHVTSTVVLGADGQIRLSGCTWYFLETD